MHEILLQILSLWHIRECWAKIADKYSASQCKKAFVDAMNEKAAQYGMIHTKWINPSGLGENGRYSQTTARDLALLGVHIMNYPNLIRLWKERRESAIKVIRPYVFPKIVKSRTYLPTIESDLIGDSFHIVFGKIGSGDGYNTLLVICKIPNRDGLFSACIMQAENAEKRFDAMHELFLVVMNKKEKVESAKCACVYQYFENKPLVCVYEQSADEISAPMSISKVMTLMLCVDHMKDMSRMIYIRPSDIIGDEGYDIINAWDKVSIIDVMCVALFPSSNRCANALARECGRIILDKTANLK